MYKHQSELISTEQEVALLDYGKQAWQLFVQVKPELASLALSAALTVTRFAQLEWIEEPKYKTSLIDIDGVANALDIAQLFDAVVSALRISGNDMREDGDRFLDSIMAVGVDQSQNVLGLYLLLQAAAETRPTPAEHEVAAAKVTLTQMLIRSVTT